MKKIKILVDSSIGATPEQMAKIKVDYLPITITDTVNYQNIEDSNSDIIFRTIHRNLKNKHYYKTHQTNQRVLEQKWIKILKNFDHIIYFPLTYNLSKQYETALHLAQSRYKDKVTVIKHNLIEAALKNFIFKYHQMIENSELNVAQIQKKIKESEKYLNGRIIIPDIDVLSRSGRVKNWQQKLTKLLKIRIILRFQKNETLTLDGKTRNTNKELENIVAGLKKTNYDLKQQLWKNDSSIAVIHTFANESDPLIINAKSIIAQTTNVKKINLHRLSNTLLVHVGPDTIGYIVSKP